MAAAIRPPAHAEVLFAHVDWPAGQLAQAAAYTPRPRIEKHVEFAAIGRSGRTPTPPLASGGEWGRYPGFLRRTFTIGVCWAGRNDSTSLPLS